MVLPFTQIAQTKLSMHKPDQFSLYAWLHRQILILTTSSSKIFKCWIFLEMKVTYSMNWHYKCGVIIKVFILTKR